MIDIVGFVTDHHGFVVEIGGALLAILNVVITMALRIEPLQDWVSVAEKSPRIAAFVRLLGASGIQPVPVLQALIDLIRGQASPGTLASAKTLQVSSSKPLISPPAPPAPKDPKP